MCGFLIGRHAENKTNGGLKLRFAATANFRFGTLGFSGTPLVVAMV
jgi:hypothetical protein